MIQTKSGKDELVGFHGKGVKVKAIVKVKIAALPQDGKANKHLIRFLSRQFAVKQSDIALLKGLVK